MTVPALGCPEISRWDLTRHRLSSLPYSPNTGGQMGRDAMRGGNSVAVHFLFFIQTSISSVGGEAFAIRLMCPLTLQLKRAFQFPIFESTQQKVI